VWCSAFVERFLRCAVSFVGFRSRAELFEIIRAHTWHDASRTAMSTSMPRAWNDWLVEALLEPQRARGALAQRDRAVDDTSVPLPAGDTAKFSSRAARRRSRAEAERDTLPRTWTTIFRAGFLPPLGVRAARSNSHNGQFRSCSVTVGEDEAAGNDRPSPAFFRRCAGLHHDAYLVGV